MRDDRVRRRLIAASPGSRSPGAGSRACRPRRPSAAPKRGLGKGATSGRGWRSRRCASPPAARGAAAPRQHDADARGRRPSAASRARARRRRRSAASARTPASANPGAISGRQTTRTLGSWRHQPFAQRGAAGTPSASPRRCRRRSMLCAAQPREEQLHRRAAERVDAAAPAQRGDVVAERRALRASPGRSDASREQLRPAACRRTPRPAGRRGAARRRRRPRRGTRLRSSACPPAMKSGSASTSDVRPASSSAACAFSRSMRRVQTLAQRGVAARGRRAPALGEHARQRELDLQQVGPRRAPSARPAPGRAGRRDEQAHRDLARRACLRQLGERRAAAARGVGSSPARRASAAAPSTAPRSSARRLRRSCSAWNDVEHRVRRARPSAEHRR